MNTIPKDERKRNIKGWSLSLMDIEVLSVTSFSLRLFVTSTFYISTYLFIMKSTTTILLLQSIVACTAFTMPEKLPNGVYSVHANDQGLEVYEGLTVDHSTTVIPKAPSSKVEARQWKDEGGWDRSQPEMYCGCGYVQTLTSSSQSSSWLIYLFHVLVFP
jgi:hypothetical protein